jgi:aspartate/methionine/tyrosine aminotransferase
MLPAAASRTASLSSGAEQVPYSKVRAIAEIAMTMEGVSPLYFGESNLPTPSFIKDAAERALRDGYTYYTSNAGLLSLREAIAAHYARNQGVKLHPESQVLVTSSGVQALNVAIRCMVDPGDEAILLTPAERFGDHQHDWSQADGAGAASPGRAIHG